MTGTKQKKSLPRLAAVEGLSYFSGVPLPDT